MYKTVSKIAKHIRCVQRVMTLLTDELQKRLLGHDASKFVEDELKGYLRFEEMPEGLEYGSSAYNAAMAHIMKDNDCFDRHSRRHDHHPEYWDCPEQGVDLGMMGLFPLMEMVSDWAGAHLSNGNEGSWLASVKWNMNKHNFSENQKWVIYELADFYSRRVTEFREDVGDA